MRSVKQIVNLIPTLRSSSVLVGCWPAFPLVPVNVGEPMGKLKLGQKICSALPLLLPVQYVLLWLVYSLSFGRYILEGKELEFYTRKIQRKKGKGAGAAA